MLNSLLKKTIPLIFAGSLISCSNAPEQATPPETESLQPQTLTITDLGDKWWHSALFYQIWPRSFYDADGEGSGDIQGMIQKLDYLQYLGVNGIWLTPIFEAPSYHGYDFVDFYAIDSDYGTMADFEQFIEKAHERDIKVILDLVLNHISNQHEWFIKSAQRQSGFEDYFVWKDERPAHWGRAWQDDVDDPEAVWHWSDVRQQYYYGAFGASQPDVNLSNPKVVAEFKKLAKFWLDKGVDGFRLDAVRYVIEEEITADDADQADTQGTIDYWADLRAYVNEVKPDALMVAEAWAEMAITGSYWANGKGVHSAFDFDFGYTVAELLNNSERSASFGSVDASSSGSSREALWQNLLNRKAHAPISFYSPFLTNHDQTRIMHVLGYSEAKAKIAASLLLTTPGSLYIYYGEEIGMGQAQTGDDLYKRAIMQWDNSPSAGFNQTGAIWLDQGQWFPWASNHASWWQAWWDSVRDENHASVAQQQSEPDSLLNHYRRLIQLRRSHPALYQPESISYYPVSAADAWLVHYQNKDESLWVLMNLNSEQVTQLTLPDTLNGPYLDLLSQKELSLEQSFTLQPAQTLILKTLNSKDGK